MNIQRLIHIQKYSYSFESIFWTSLIKIGSTRILPARIKLNQNTKQLELTRPAKKVTWKKLTPIRPGQVRVKLGYMTQYRTLSWIRSGISYFTLSEVCVFTFIQGKRRMEKLASIRFFFLVCAVWTYVMHW